ncbi:hypothetical protein [Modestobacter roseus]|uniref:hypothetical protein n=1 Tax=Modestobacter roseus TaxID=1181884 RepID=UPI0034DF1B3E
MVVVAALLVLVAVGLLVAGVVLGEPVLQWSSFGVSALATLLIAVGALRNRAGRESPDEVRTPYHPQEPDAEPTDLPPTDLPPTDLPPTDLPPAGGGRPGSALAGLASPGDDEVVRRVAPPPVPPSSPMLPRVGGATRWEDSPAPAAQPPAAGEPPAEDVEFSDLLLIMDLTDEVLVIDEHPRYHVAGCPRLAGVPTIPIPMLQARTDGFTPCGWCSPDRTMAQRERARRG